MYWFDDTGRGQCRVPASWRVSWRDGGAWVPVDARGEPGVERDRFNRLEFEPVTTTALRLDVRLSPKFSGGVLDWRVLPPASP